MSDQWRQQPYQQVWGQQPPPSQQVWGPPPGQQIWGHSPTPGQQAWGPPPYQQAWRQPSLNGGWQQHTLYPGQFQPPQPQPKKKRNLFWPILGIVMGALVFCGIMGSFLTYTSDANNTTDTNNTTADQTITQTVQPTPTPSPTPPPSPTPNPAQTEADYKASTTSITVTNLDKIGSADQGKDVHFISKIFNFAKDSTGNTAGANVIDPDAYSRSVIQVLFTDGTDVTQLNEGDILEVWGHDEGVTNPFLQEVEITVKYMTDQTTNYQADIHTGTLASFRIA